MEKGGEKIYSPSSTSTVIFIQWLTVTNWNLWFVWCTHTQKWRKYFWNEFGEHFSVFWSNEFHFKIICLKLLCAESSLALLAHDSCLLMCFDGFCFCHTESIQLSYCCVRLLSPISPREVIIVHKPLKFKNLSCCWRNEKLSIPHRHIPWISCSFNSCMGARVSLLLFSRFSRDSSSLLIKKLCTYWEKLCVMRVNLKLQWILAESRVCHKNSK